MDIWLPPKPAIIRPASEVKKANFLPGWFPAGAVAGPAGPSLSAVSFGDSGDNAAVYTFSGVSFGAAASDRLLIIAVGGGSNAGPLALVSVTIGGVSATIHAQANNSGNTRNGHAGIASAAIPTGTSGDVVVTWTDLGVSMLDMAYALYRVTGLASTTPTDTATASGGSPSMLIDRANLGFIIAAASAQGASFNTWPSPMVTDIDSNTDGTFESMGHTPVTAGAVTNFNAGPSNNGGSPSRYAAASWA